MFRFLKTAFLQQEPDQPFIAVGKRGLGLAKGDDLLPPPGPVQCLGRPITELVALIISRKVGRAFRRGLEPAQAYYQPVRQHVPGLRRMFPVQIFGFDI